MPSYFLLMYRYIPLKFSDHGPIAQAIIREYPFPKDKSAGSGICLHIYTVHPIQLCDRWDSANSKPISNGTAMHHRTMFLFCFI